MSFSFQFSVRKTKNCIYILILLTASKKGKFYSMHQSAYQASPWLAQQTESHPVLGSFSDFLVLVFLGALYVPLFRYFNPSRVDMYISTGERSIYSIWLRTLLRAAAVQVPAVTHCKVSAMALSNFPAGLVAHRINVIN